MGKKIELFHRKVEVKVLLEVLAVHGILALVFVGVYYLEPTITGFVTVEKHINYTDEVDLEFNETGTYTWNLGNPGDLKGVKISGSKIGQGQAKVYIEDEGVRYLIFDSSQLVEKESGIFSITGFAVADGGEENEEEIEEIPTNQTPINDATINETNETTVINESIEPDVEIPTNQTPINDTTINETLGKTINFDLEYGDNEFYDENNDGVESLNGIIDFSVENTEFNWDVDEEKLCTRYEVFSVEVQESTFACFGNDNCCNFVDLQSEGAWNDSLFLGYGGYGSTNNNLILAQVMYVDFNLSVENPYADIHYSSWSNLTAKFLDDEIQFEDVCIESCMFDGNASSYNLIVELEDTKLMIDEIRYLVEERTANTYPILIKNIENLSLGENKNYTLDLSEYFYDEDGDELAYGYNEMDNITILFEDNFAYIMADEGFTGNRFTFITASDSFGQAVSNVFRIDVEGERAIGRFEVRDKDDNKLMVIDSFGNLNIKGNLIQNASIDENDFVIEGENNSFNLVVTNPEGNLQIKGSINEDEGALNPGPDSFVVINKGGGVVAYVNSTGSLFLRGTLSEGVLFE